MVTTARILIVDDNRLFREGLKRILSGNRFGVAKEAHSFLGALKLLQADDAAVDLLLGDPGTDPREFEAVNAILRQFSDVKVVILTDRLTPPWSELALKSGAVGFLSKNISTEALKHSLDLVLMGEQIIPTAAPRAPSSAPAPLCSDAHDPAAEILATLSGRENQILDCLMHGLPNKLIARELEMAEATVKVHLKALLRKLKAQNRTQAAIWAIKSGSTSPRVMKSEAQQIGEISAAVEHEGR